MNNEIQLLEALSSISGRLADIDHSIGHVDSRTEISFDVETYNMVSFGFQNLTEAVRELTKVIKNKETA